MNFDFLKDLRSLGHVYENCINAEKLAITMPVQSVFTARKSAELLAKFIYMTAHNQEIEDLTFADILADITVRRFINSPNVMDAFHYIRKSGNRAVHGNDEESADEAISVLQDLHYVAGETACMLGLIDNYPLFEDEITAFPEAKYVGEEDINNKAKEMFLEYVEAFNAQQEREQYMEMEDYDWFSYSIEGNVEMHEYLELKYRPKNSELIEYLQNYLLTLVRFSIERSPEKAEELGISCPVTLNARITIGEETYSSENLEIFRKIIAEMLPKANGFTIDLSCSGVLREYYNDEPDEGTNGRFNMIRKDAVWTGAGMLDMLERYKRRNAFEYKLSAFYPDSGEQRYEKIHNGKEIDIISLCTDAIIDQEFEDEWWSWELNLYADFDFEKYNDKLLQLQEVVKNNIPESEVKYCEDVWSDGDYAILCDGIQWNCHSLREIQDFLDKVNEILLPIKDEINADCEGTWEIQDKFAIAIWEWTEKGFKVKGHCY